MLKTQAKDTQTTTNGKLGLAEILVLLSGGGQPPVKVTAYDGSSVGPDDAALGVDLLNPRATT
ncbi:SAM-dependent methyltransferase, partial [Mycolicibacter sinensis]